MQSDLHAHLDSSLSNYADDGLVGPFKDDMGYLADLAHEYRYCSNCVIAELVDFAIPMVRPSCANRCDLLERWS